MANGYILIATGTMKAGDKLTAPNPDVLDYVVGDPRQIAFLDSHPQQEAENILDSLTGDRLAVAKLKPRRKARTIAGTPFLECEAGWQVAEILGIETMFGPQGEAFVLAAKLAHERLAETVPDNDPAVVRFDQSATPRSQAIIAAESAALDALEKVADRFSWESTFDPFYSHPLVALAARDLIGTVPEWDETAYGQLIEAWKAAFGTGPHPDDK